MGPFQQWKLWRKCKEVCVVHFTTHTRKVIARKAYIPSQARIAPESKMSPYRLTTGNLSSMSIHVNAMKIVNAMSSFGKAHMTLRAHMREGATNSVKIENMALNTYFRAS